MTEQAINNLQAAIKGALKPSRWQHTLRCQESAINLAKHYKLNCEKVALAALCHDAFRDLSAMQWLRLAELREIPMTAEEEHAPVLFHGPLAAKYLEIHWGCRQADVLAAIYYHTSGHRDLDSIGKVIFIADGIEPGRDFPQREIIEKVAYQNLDEACLRMLESNISYLEKHNLVCHPDSYEWLVTLKSKERTAFDFES